jgi:predicted DNA-binding transcriptional regulator YafY
VTRGERLVRLLDLLRGAAGLEGEALARRSGVSPRTLVRDLAALREAGFPVVYDRGYRLAFPLLLPPVTFTGEEALALRLAARSAASRADPATVESLTHAAEKLQQALAAVPPAQPPDRQLSLALPVDDARTEGILQQLGEAVRERRTVKLAYASADRPGSERAVDPYQVFSLPSGPLLLAYSHRRRRLIRIAVGRLDGVVVTRRRYRPLPSRVLQRHLLPAPEAQCEYHRVRILCRPPLALLLRKQPPAGALMWEEAPAGAIVFTLATPRPEDLVPWLLACGEALEVQEPARLRQAVFQIARDVAERHRTIADGGTPSAEWRA